jgi:Holliday junction resolvase RusA-like endonuclease
MPDDVDGVTFSVFGVAQPAGSKRAFVHTHTKRVVVTDDARRSRPWKQEVAAVATEAMLGRELYTGPLALELEVTVTRPRGHYGKRGLLPSAPIYPTTRPDLLKLARAVEDALTGIVYRDDALIIVEHLRKGFGEPARVDVSIRPLDGTGS